MKILLLPAYYYPEPAASIYLSINRNEDFIKAGFDIEMFVPMPTRGITKEQRNRYKKNKTEYLYGGKMLIHRFPMFREGKNPILRAMRYVLCCFLQFFKGYFSKNVDVIFIESTPPIQAAMGAVLKKVKRIPFVYNLQDIFPDSLLSAGLTKRNSFIWKIGRVIENFTYRNADKIIVISEDFRHNILAKGVLDDKIEVIYNWVNKDEIVNINRNDNKLFEKYKLDINKFYITYCGNIGLSQNMNLLLEVAAELNYLKDIYFVIIGEGAYKSQLKTNIVEKGIDNVTLLPFQPYTDISQVFSLGDVGLVISKEGTGINSLPSKTWNIMSAERPVLANFDENELKRIIEKNNIGIFTKAGDIYSLKKAILHLYKNRNKCLEMGKNGRQFVLDNLSRNTATQKYIKIIKQFIKT
jgi:glycosyltransferase involved in cell wall biosynthesis